MAQQSVKPVGLGAVDLKSLSDNALDAHIKKLQATSSLLVDKFIAQGRGHERHSDIVAKSDALSQTYKALTQEIREAIDHRDYRRSHGSKFARGKANDSAITLSRAEGRILLAVLKTTK